MKKATLIIVVLLCVRYCQGHHIVGGEMFYTFLGKGTKANTSKYLITLRIFRDQNVPPNTAKMPAEVYIGIFDNDNGRQYRGPYPYYIVEKSSETQVPVNSFPPCINNGPILNYHVGIFQLRVELPDNSKGYTAAYQTCCRVDNLQNVYNENGDRTGSTFTCNIPPAAYEDNSPEFSTNIDVICAKKPFKLDYSAKDADGNVLVYSFGPAYGGGLFKDEKNANPAGPPYSLVPYSNAFSSDEPLGHAASINPQTGIISGIAPDVGKYVLGVKVQSYRNGTLINEHYKDFIVNVTDCDFAGVQLNPRPAMCDSFNVAFQNDNSSSMNQNFFWDFGDGNTSTLRNPIHHYADSGTYIYKLIVNKGQQCTDSAIQTVRVYPGFNPSFSSDGKCINSTIFFTDRSTSFFGTVNNWKWDFGDPLTNADTSANKNPGYIYKNPGNYQVQLTVSDNLGCVKTISETIPIKTKPDFFLNNDTLMCDIDTLQLTAIGNGSVSWTPDFNINNIHSFTPLVSPKKPFTYYATLVESRGCIATDSVFVNVVDHVSLNLNPDTTICLTDTAEIHPVSDGLHYLWTPSLTIINDAAKFAQVIPIENTTYHVVSSIGKCSATANIRVNVVPYPKANAGKDTAICFPKSYQLHATGGSIYNWTPPLFLNNTKIPDPVTTPQESIRYIVQVNDVLGCPKPRYDSVVIRLQNPIADAGPADTSIVINQPLQLNGTGAEFYSWSPSTGLNNAQIQNPIAILSESQKYTLRVYTNVGCFSTDTIHVTVYKVKPDLYVPDAFTPNGDAINDVFRPIPVGMKKLNYFKIYNREGQLIFSTNTEKAGWNGTFKGQPQDPDVFVWIAEGVDYLGKVIFKKGSVTLIR